ncbi:DsbA family protein [Glycomyces rhizosphaerae]|uniref:DsbA family protein n=1 Tax=Glycomyces rhizosphaerae TaxID=2054422 RepID=A0ABV7Q820_9ACTN
MATSSRKPAAAALRKQQEAQARRKRIVFGTAIGASVLLIGGLLGFGIWMNRDVDYDVNEPAAATTDTYAVEIGDGPVTIDLYIDYMCPACKQFEDAYAADLQRWVDEGSVTINYHPIAILNRMSQGTEYSTRAGAAAVCAADAGEQDFLDYTLALYAAQPAENTRGLDDDELVRIGTDEAGLDAEWETCVADETYRGWIEEGTTSASSEQGVSGTPTAMVDGRLVDSATFAESVEAAITAASLFADLETSATDRPRTGRGRGWVGRALTPSHDPLCFPRCRRCGHACSRNRQQLGGSPPLPERNSPVTFTRSWQAAGRRRRVIAAFGATALAATSLTVFAYTATADPALPASPTSFKDGRSIVQFVDEPVAVYDGSVAGLEATTPDDGERIAFDSDAVQDYRAHLGSPPRPHRRVHRLMIPRSGLRCPSAGRASEARPH